MNRAGTLVTAMRKRCILMVHSWSSPLSPTEAARRAGGGRRYNATRPARSQSKRDSLLHELQSLELIELSAWFAAHKTTEGTAK